MPSTVDHINIVVSDLVASERFYTELLGFEVMRRARLEGAWIDAIVGLAGVQADVVYVQPKGGGPRIELLHYISPPSGEPVQPSQANMLGLRHMAIRVDDIDGLYARLLQEGVTFFGPPTAVPPGTIRHDEGRKRLCYLRDPDGVILELAEYN
jgi:catechol 2,3-dioxygenase-like lactoylglutathione lyase family enzyme